MPSSAPNTHLPPDQPLTPLHRVVNLLVGFAPVTVALLLVILAPGFSEVAETVVVWLLFLALFILADVLAEPIQYGHWAGNAHLAVTAAWLTLGFLPALLLLAVGSAVTGSVRLRYSPSLGLPILSRSEVQRHVLMRLLICSLSLLAAAVVYRLLNGPVPLRDAHYSDLLALGAALLTGFLATQILGVWLAARLYRLAAQPIWTPSKRERLLPELSLLLLAVTLPAIFYSSGIVTFGVILALVIGYTLRYRQVELASRESARLYRYSADLIQKLSLVNSTVQNAMFNVDQPTAVQTACETAVALTQADSAAVFLINRDQGTLSLAFSIGLNPVHEQAGRDLPYQPEHFAFSPRLIPDTEQAAPVTRDFARRAGFRALVEMPLRYGNVMLGYLAVFHNQPRHPLKTEIDLLEILANQLTAALDNAQLLQTLEIHAFEMTHLVELSRISTASLDLSQVAADVSALLLRITGMDSALIALLENGHMNLLGAGAPKSTLPPLPELRHLQEQASVRPVTFQEFAPGVSPALQSFMADSGLASLHLLPLIAHDAMFGALLLGTVQARPLSEREIQLLEAAAHQIASQLDNIRLYQQTHAALNSRLQQLSLIEDIVQRISSSHDFSAIISDVFEAAMKTTQADMAALALLSDADDLWVIEESRLNGETIRQYSNQALDRGVIGRVIQTGEILLVSDNHQLDYYYPAQSGSYLSSLAVPLMKNDQTVGVLNVESCRPGAFTMEQANFLKNLGSHAIISINNARLLEALQYQIDTLDSLRAFSLSSASAVSTDEVCQAVLRTALQIAGGDYAALFHYDRAADQLIPLIGTERADHTQAEADLLVKVAHQAAVSSDVYPCADAAAVFPDYPAAPSLLYRSLIAVPITHGGDVDEVLCIAYRERQNFENRNLNALSLLAMQAAGHMDNALLHERLNDGNSRMRAILDSTRDGIILLDNVGRLIEENPAARRLIGLPLSEYINQPLVEVLLKYAETDEEAQAGYSREELTRLARIQRLEPEGITRREFSRQAQPNQIIYVEEIGSPVTDETGSAVGRLLVLRDITEEKLLESYREEITGMAVHDLRSPLASIINALKIAKDNLGNPVQVGTVEQTIDISLTSADRLLNLVNSLLEIRRGKHMTLERAPISIEELVELARLTLLAAAERAGIQVQVVIPPGLPLVDVDADKIRRVLINLLDNALRFTPTGREIQISAALDEERGKVVLRVADSGMGIPRTERERIFEQFWQVKGNQPLRGSKGSGIGLAFCYRVLEAHHERIWVEDKGPLPGACFAFTLPVVSG